MSVPKSKRSVSSVLFLKELRELEVLMISLQPRIPKRHYYFFERHILSYAAEALSCAKEANSIFIVTEDDYNTRRKLIYRAITQLQALSSQLDILYDMRNDKSKSLISDAQLENSARLISSITSTLRKVLTKDRSTYKKAMNKTIIE